LQGLTRELGRQVVEATYNEAEAACSVAPRLCYNGGEYARLHRPSPHRRVATLFGPIALWRRGYRYVERDVAEPLVFPLERALGLVQGVTPALAEVATRALAEAGATQQAVLERLREEHGVVLGVKRLRALAADVETELTPHRRAQQAAQLNAWLEQAARSPGKNRPVLAVGRDGITLATRPHGFFEVATVATLTVYDRSRNRLGSVYLGLTPELGQATLSGELTALVQATLAACHPLEPRLVYLTDAGDAECGYYQRVLRKLRHPTTGRRLEWRRILDYYHASGRLTTIAAALLGADTRAARSWSAKMRKVLKQPNGVFRVLHSAAALAARRKLSARPRKEYQRAYNYLRARARHLRYHDYRRLGLPIGSGVTEAACKTLFTQRLKLSGMRWSAEGAQRILNLRSIRLSGVWDATYCAALQARQYSLPRTPAPSPIPTPQKAA
jgi:hypothetical protein